MEKKWFIGIDVSKKTIDVVYYDRKRQKVCEEIHRQFSNDQSGFKLMRNISICPALLFQMIHGQNLEIQ